MLMYNILSNVALVVLGSAMAMANNSIPYVLGYRFKSYRWNIENICKVNIYVICIYIICYGVIGKIQNKPFINNICT